MKRLFVLFALALCLGMFAAPAHAQCVTTVGAPSFAFQSVATPTLFLQQQPVLVQQPSIILGRSAVVGGNVVVSSGLFGRSVVVAGGANVAVVNRGLFRSTVVVGPRGNVLIRR